MTSTPSLLSWRAISILSSAVKETPGVCSPSLSVVSKIRMVFVVFVGHAFSHFSLVKAAAMASAMPTVVVVPPQSGTD